MAFWITCYSFTSTWHFTDKVKHIMSNQHGMFNVSNNDYGHNNVHGVQPL